MENGEKGVIAGNNRSRIHLLKKFLHKNADDSRVASVAELIDRMETDVNGNKNTIRDSIKALKDDHKQNFFDLNLTFLNACILLNPIYLIRRGIIEMV